MTYFDEGGGGKGRENVALAYERLMSVREGSVRGGAPRASALMRPKKRRAGIATIVYSRCGLRQENASLKG